MNTRNIIIGAIVVFILGIVAGYATHGQPQLAGAISPAGTINSNAVVQTVSMSLGTLAGTSTSIFNNSGYDYFVHDSFAVCTGIQQASTSVANWLLQGATTSVANTGLQGNTNYAINLTVPTSTAVAGSVNAATSTGGGGPAFVSNIWPNQTYMTFTFNATNTAACTVGSNVVKL